MFAFTHTLFRSRKRRTTVSRRHQRPHFFRPLRTEQLEDRRLLSQTVGLFVNDARSFDGYTLFSPSVSDSTYLIDNDGKVAHSWQSDYTPMSAYLLDDGSLLRAAQLRGTSIFAPGASGRIERFSWEGELVWEYELSNAQYQLHHDIEMLPNGNILMIAWERKTMSAAIAEGRDPSLLQAENNNELWPDMIIEVEPTGSSGGNIVWEWHLWDHLIQDRYPAKSNYGVVADHPELVDINYVPTGEGAGGVLADWTHFNGIDYNAELDQIIVSSREFSEFWIIDHSTTTAEAAGSTGGRSGAGGDLLYRWGNPQTYDRGTAADQVFAYQHDAQWIEDGLLGAGNILVFNNGWNRPDGSYSSVDELTPPLKHQWYLNNKTDGSVDDLIILDTLEVAASWVPLTGDWNGDGIDTTGWYDPAHNVWYFNNRTDGSADGLIVMQAPAAPAAWIPLTGDWNGDGRDTPGLYDPQNNVWYFNNKADGSDDDVIVMQVPSAPASWIPLIGDWNGDRKDTAGLYDPDNNVWYFTNRMDGSTVDLIVMQTASVPASWIPLSGDWNGDGRDTAGLYDADDNVWYFTNRMDGSTVDLLTVQAPSVPAAWRPLIGDWNGNGRDTAGLYDPSYAFGNYTIYPGKPFGPTDLAWTYRSAPRSDFFATIISGAQRLPNGNTLVNEGTEGRFFEVTPAGEIVWEYVNPVVAWGPLAQGEPIPPANFGIPGVNLNLVFRAYRYGPSYPGLAGRDLTPGEPLEYYFYFETAGLYDPGSFTWYMNNKLNGSVDDMIVMQTEPVPSSWIPLAGDWNGDGIDTPGLYDSEYSVWYLNNNADGSTDDLIIMQAPPVPRSWIPLAGDWNGDGMDTPGMYDPDNSVWYLNNKTDGSEDDRIVMQTEPVPSSWIPLTGDWNGDGVDTPGLYDPVYCVWYLNNRTDGSVDDLIVMQTPLVPSTWAPITGDWDGDGTDTPGLYDRDNFIWYFNNKTDGSVDDLIILHTSPVPRSWIPLTGDWNGSIAGGQAAVTGSVATAESESDAAEFIDVPPVNLTVETMAEQGASRNQDVNGDGLVTPLDALLVLNRLTRGSDSQTDTDSALDVNGDGLLSPIDALLVINHLNHARTAEGELASAIDTQPLAEAIPPQARLPHRPELRRQPRIPNLPQARLREVTRDLLYGAAVEREQTATRHTIGREELLQDLVQPRPEDVDAVFETAFSSRFL